MDDNTYSLDELFAQLEKRRKDKQPAQKTEEAPDNGAPKWMIPSSATVKAKVDEWWNGKKEKAERSYNSFWKANPQTTSRPETLGEKLKRIKLELRTELRKCRE